MGAFELPMPVMTTENPFYPLRLRDFLFHGGPQAQRVLKNCAFVTPSSAIAKMFARGNAPGIRTKFIEGREPLEGFVSRYMVTALPRLMLLPRNRIFMLAHWLAHAGYGRIHQMPLERGKRPRKGMYLSEIAVAWCRAGRTKPRCDGWVCPYEDDRMEYVLNRPSKWLKYWGTTHVSPLDHERALGPNVPWGEFGKRGPWGLKGLGGLEVEEEPFIPSGDRFIEIEE